MQPGQILRFGIAPGSWNASTRAQLDDFCSEVARVAQLAIAPFAAADYRAAVDAIEDGQLDVAWLPPVVALRGVSRGALVPLAIPIRDGVSTFSAVLFTREVSPIRTMSDLKGCSAAWVDSQSAAGYLVIRAKLNLEGVDLSQAFAFEEFCGTHPRVVHAVLSGRADVGATYARLGDSGNVLSAAWIDAGFTGPVHIITQAGPIPGDILAMSARTPVAAGRALQNALVHSPPSSSLSVAARALFDCDGFEIPRREHLAPLARLVDGLRETSRFNSAFPPARGPA